MRLLKTVALVTLIVMANITPFLICLEAYKHHINDDKQLEQVQELADIMAVCMTYDYEAAKHPIIFNLKHKGQHYTYDDLIDGMSGLCTTYTQTFVDVAEERYGIYSKRVDHVKTPEGNHSYVDILFSTGWYRFDITSYCNSPDSSILKYLTKK